MCGICGIISSEYLQQEDYSLVSIMNDSMAHRGPDDSGLFIDSNISLAMRRLSIIDVVGGKQPLTNEDNTIVLIANGEIYNYIELSKELKARRHRFKTGSDCETIVHLYEEFGIQCLSKLRGMFAFALWDKQNQQLFIARDRIGEKPLYFCQQDGRLTFASELRALIKAMPNSLSLDPLGVDMYMHYQYVPEPMTIIKDVQKLQAGHFLLVKPVPWNIISKRYWNIESATPINHSNPPQCILQELDQVTSLILRSDVPIGIALSGGMDSNAIAALSNPKYTGALHAFTVGYEGIEECDETNRAKLTAKELNLPFHQIKISTNDFIMSFPQLIFYCDEPVADIAGYGYFSIMKEARKHNVPVILTGFGGDELFWGYPWVVESMMANAKKLSLLGDSPQACNNIAREMTFYERHYEFKTAEQILPMIYTTGFKKYILPQNAYKPFRIEEPYESLPVRICRALFDTWLVSNCIVLGDRLSMASSVELRLPLLDYKLVELVMGLRKSYKTDYALEPKKWFKEAIRNILPERIINHPKKSFMPPYRKWIIGTIKRYSYLLNNSYLVENKIIDPERLQQLFAEPIINRAILHFVYKLLVLEMWARLVLEGQTTHSSSEIFFRQPEKAMA